MTWANTKTLLARLAHQRLAKRSLVLLFFRSQCHATLDMAVGHVHIYPKLCACSCLFFTFSPWLVIRAVWRAALWSYSWGHHKRWMPGDLLVLTLNPAKNVPVVTADLSHRFQNYWLWRIKRIKTPDCMKKCSKTITAWSPCLLYEGINVITFSVPTCFKVHKHTHMHMHFIHKRVICVHK